MICLRDHSRPKVGKKVLWVGIFTGSLQKLASCIRAQVEVLFSSNLVRISGVFDVVVS